MMDIDISNIKTPAYVVDERLLIKNLEILKKVIDATGCKILLAQKAFSMFSLYPTISKYLDGSTSSGLFEAKLGFEYMEGEVHIFSPAYNPLEIDEIISICDHIVFNSFEQWNKFKDKILDAPKKIQVGIRVNPEYSEIHTDLYNPCFEYSRLGTTLKNFDENMLKGIDGLHFHTMCEQNSDVLERTLTNFEEKFGKYLHALKWINFGGGHHITRTDYDLDKLIFCINNIKNKYNVQVYLEPGEAVALNTGYLVTTVLETMENEINIAILDTSAACHMPDVLEMPYRPDILGEVSDGIKYRLGSLTCLAGDVIGDYSFAKKLEINDKLVLTDMAHYTMVKNNTFNGINLPNIYIYTKEKALTLIREFSYEDFKNRLS